MCYVFCSLNPYAPVQNANFSDDKEKHTHVRLLVSNAMAGSIIGKGGSTINDFQSQSAARIQLSRNHEIFPGTSDRIILISGTFDEVLKATELILEKILSEVWILICYCINKNFILSFHCRIYR